MLKGRDFTTAIAAYDRAIQIQPDLQAAYKGRGIAHRRLGHRELAMHDLDRATQLDPKDAEAYLERGGVYASLRQFDHAIQDFDSAIRIKPDYAQAYSARGMAEVQSGDAAGAEADRAKAASLGYSSLRVGTHLEHPKLIRQVPPVYPKKAKKEHVTGVVRVKAVISKDGTVRDVQLVSGDVLLASAAIEAVKQWVYAPARMDGQPVDMLTQIDVTFALPK